MTLADALAELDTQHADLRERMARCEQLADELDAGVLDPQRLTREIVELRLAFDAHNKFEEQVLPLVVEHARIVEDHAGEHRVMRERLGSTETRALRETIDLLRAHLDAEQRFAPH
jgi:hypothetical protein